MPVEDMAAHTAVVDGAASLFTDFLDSSSSGTESQLQGLQKLVTSATPEFRTTYNAALGDLMTEIDGVVPAMKQDIAHSQDLLNNHLDTLRIRTDEVLQSKMRADNRDKNFGNCVTAQKNKLKTLLDEESAANDARTRRDILCKLRDASVNLDYNAGALQLQAKCNFKTPNQCTQVLTSLRQKKAKACSDSDAEHKRKKAVLANHTKLCADQEQLSNSLAQRWQSAQDDYSSQMAACELSKERRSVAMCDFGVRLQAKCAAATDMRAYVNRVSIRDGTVHSEADRKIHYAQIDIMDCILDKLKRQTMQPEDAAHACRARGSASRYSSQVGLVNLKNSEYKALMTAANFDCIGKRFKFQGKSWTLPKDPTNPQLSDFKIQSWVPTVTIEPSSAAPYPWCTAWHPWHLAPQGAMVCDYGNPVTSADECKNVANILLARLHKNERDMRSGSWKWVPKGCNLKSGTDFEPLWSTYSNADNNYNKGSYSLLCSGM